MPAAAAIIPAVIGAGGAVGGGIMGQNAADAAADAQRSASEAATNLQVGMYLQNRRDMQPFLRSARERLPYQAEALEEYSRRIMEGPGKFEDSPYYENLQNTLQGSIEQAAEAMMRGARASGGGPGSIGRDMAKYAAPLAGQLTMQGRQNWLNEWLQQLNPLAAQAMVGQTPYGNSSAQISQLGQNAASNVGTGLMNAGQATAAGNLGRGAAWTGALNQGLNTLGQMYGSGAFNSTVMDPNTSFYNSPAGQFYNTQYGSQYAPGQTNTGMLSNPKYRGLF